MDAKSKYSNTVGVVKKLGLESQELTDILTKGKWRYEQYGGNWISVNINDVIERFAPGANPMIQEGKIYFYNKDRTIAVVADVAGGYLRIEDFRKKTKHRQYLDLDGNDAHNVTENGKTRGRSKSEYQSATHYRIKKREEMK